MELSRLAHHDAVVLLLEPHVGLVDSGAGALAEDTADAAAAGSYSRSTGPSPDRLAASGGHRRLRSVYRSTRPGASGPMSQH